MNLHLLYFASLKENLGMAEERVDVPAAIVTVGLLRDWLAQQGRAAIATTRNLRCAVNQEMGKLDAPIKEGDEVAFFPPVTGG